MPQKVAIQFRALLPMRQPYLKLKEAGKEKVGEKWNRAEQRKYTAPKI